MSLGDEVKSEMLSEMEARWRYKLRHPDFRKDIRELRKVYKRDPQEASPIHKQLIEKWGLKDIPFDIVTVPYIPDDPPYKNAFYETICPQATIRYPVEARDLAQNEPEPSTMPPTLKSGQFLQITLDLTYPDRFLLSLISEEIRSVRPQKRHRDKDDDYLEVYDRAEKGETIGTIATGVGIEVPTAKARLRTACERIYGPGNIPPKWRIALSSFNAETHLVDCSMCTEAFSKEDWSEDDLCPAARRFLTQDHVAQRELPLPEPERYSPR